MFAFLARQRFENDADRTNLLAQVKKLDKRLHRERRARDREQVELDNLTEKWRKKKILLEESRIVVWDKMKDINDCRESFRQKVQLKQSLVSATVAANLKTRETHQFACAERAAAVAHNTKDEKQSLLREIDRCKVALEHEPGNHRGRMQSIRENHRQNLQKTVSDMEVKASLLRRKLQKELDEQHRKLRFFQTRRQEGISEQCTIISERMATKNNAMLQKFREQLEKGLDMSSEALNDLKEQRKSLLARIDLQQKKLSAYSRFQDELKGRIHLMKDTYIKLHQRDLPQHQELVLVLKRTKAKEIVLKHDLESQKHHTTVIVDALKLVIAERDELLDCIESSLAEIESRRKSFSTRIREKIEQALEKAQNPEDGKGPLPQTELEIGNQAEHAIHSTDKICT